MPSPTIYACTPSLLPVSPAGSNFEIIGRGFDAVNPGTKVQFGAVDCTNVVVRSTFLITCTAPAHPAGTPGLMVIQPDTSSTSVTGPTFV
jgi:hypothetical protein